MSEYEETENEENPLLAIKYHGTPVDIRKARSWYLSALKTMQSRVSEISSMFSSNLNQSIPYTKLSIEDILTITDDCIFTAGNIEVYSQMVLSVVDMYKNPNSYRAWAGTLDGEIAYYVEKTETEDTPEGMYI
jgi:hypothetical protein